MSKKSNLLLLHFIVFIFGFTGILGELITLPSELLVFYRCMIAFIALVMFGFTTKKLKRFPLKMTLTMMGVGVVTATHWSFFFAAIKVSTISVGVAIMASTALWVALFEPLVVGRRVDWRELVLGTLVMLGLGIIFSVEIEYKLGIILAVISAMLAAVFSVLNSRLIKKVDSVNISTYEMLSASAVLFLYTWINGDIHQEITQANLCYLILLGVVATAFAFVVSVEVMKELSPFTVGLSFNLEPIYTIVLALLIFGDQERMNRGFYIGTAILILAIFLDTFMRRHQRKKAQKNNSPAT